MAQRALPALLLAALLLPPIATSCAAEAPEPESLATPDDFLSLLFDAPRDQSGARRVIVDSWQPGYAVMALEILYFSRNPGVRDFLVSTLERQTGQRLGDDVQAWYEWIWSRPAVEHPQYATFKKRLYRHIDQRFDAYFDDTRHSDIRLDEVRWGGVQQDGIPPLRGPEMITATEADYLADDNVVFGIEVEGDVRAYPKRILAWHEMFTDTVGGVPVAGVYCTLCGTVILYETERDGVAYRLGTSGFLYRSNKLMYDQATQSLWNTLWGKPAIGPLTGQGIALARRSVVTTTWGEWRRRHPETLVLSLDTGYERDYGEGAAYRDYFATDRLMFNVPALDRRLANKAEVLTLVPEKEGTEPLAIAAKYLTEHDVYHDRIGTTDFVVLTDPSGANRVYGTGGLRFARWDGDRRAIDEGGTVWTLGEGALTTEDGRRLPRIPAQRAFWFGWYAAFPDTRLVR